ncbi:pirin family protein [bacterium]|nr:pirin family protein [bacterium]
MKKQLHRASTRGSVDYRWLKSKHSFSFGEFHSPERQQFGMLRVINDDVVAPSKGFGTHPHANMEIISIPLSGTLLHKDSERNEHIIKAGEVQVMSAGNGIAHSEFNHSDSKDVNFLQTWIIPKTMDIKPKYQQKMFSFEEPGQHYIVTADERENSLWINQDAFLSIIQLRHSNFDIKLNDPEHGIYFFVIKGEVSVEGETLKSKDAVGITKAQSVNISSSGHAQVLAIEVPMS